MERVMARLQQDMRMRNLSKNTVRTYTYSIMRFSKMTGNDLTDVCDEDIRSYLDSLILAGKSPSYVNHERAALLFLCEITFGRIVNKRLVPAMKLSRKLPAVLSREEVARIIASEPYVRNRCLWMLAYGSGLRRTEAISLRASDIRSDEMRVFVRCSKRAKDRFTILPQASLDELRRWWRMRPACTEDWMFPATTSSGHITRGTINHGFSHALGRCGIERDGVSYHTLRHAFATHLVEDGVDQFTVKELLGHSSIQSTSVYVHLANAAAGVVSPLDSIAWEKR